MSESTSSHISLHLLFAFILFLLIFMLYFHSLSVGFVGDDFYFLDSSDTWSDTLDSFWSDWFWGDEDIRGAPVFPPAANSDDLCRTAGVGAERVGVSLDLIVIHWLVSCLIVPLVYLLFKGWWKQVFAAACWGAGVCSAPAPRGAVYDQCPQRQPLCPFISPRSLLTSRRQKTELRGSYHPHFCLSAHCLQRRWQSPCRSFFFLVSGLVIFQKE